MSIDETADYLSDELHASGSNFFGPYFGLVSRSSDEYSLLHG